MKPMKFTLKFAFLACMVFLTGCPAPTIHSQVSRDDQTGALTEKQQRLLLGTIESL